ncbi:hypothetical protein SAMN05421837_102196 [Amycolatopsis pretoriensis]|uniref:Uncharacterized protein n=1 Tax=Amycolatopsis pretoriensis TaxID=218821 RepID=A0A1H5QBL1_9PSEU|nr:DNA-binding protein [Amycolatopsis pretoriensis]SEF23470.1 hypothetical protein SAMN05421837_102196 [Amycolatopsis pretoriensis]
MGTETCFECIDGVADAIRELAAVVRASVPEPPADPDAQLKDQAAAGVLPHHRFGKHYRFTRGDVAEIVRLSAAPARQPRRRVPVADVAQDFRAA